MALKHLMEMTKADRYTADGCEALNKAREADVEDRTYKAGEISEKTGLQKQPDGTWAPPKKGGLGSGTSKKETENKAQLAKEIVKALEERKSKPVEHFTETKEDRQKKAQEIVRLLNERSKQKAESKPGRDYPVLKNKDHIDLAKEVKSNTMPGSDWTAEEIAKEWKLGKADAEEVKKEFDKIKESKPDFADQRDQIGGEIKGNLEAAKYYFDKAQSFSTTDPSYKTYMLKAKEYNDMAKNQADDYGFEWEERHNSGITTAVNNYAKENTDAAPRQLTGDTRLRLSQVTDKVYQIGEISQKTGLQKTANGWVKPKTGKAAPKMGSPEYNKKYGLTKKDVATGKEVDRKYEKQQNRIKELKAKGYTDEQIENDKVYQQTKEDMRNVGKKAESKPAASTTGNWKEASVDLKNQAGNGFFLNTVAFGMTPAWAKKHGYSPKDVNGSAAQNKLAEQIITSQDWNNPEEAVKKINNLDFGYNNWKVTEKQADKVKIATRDRMGNLREITIKKPQSAGDAAPRQLTGDCKIRVRR